MIIIMINIMLIIDLLNLTDIPLVIVILTFYC